MKEKISQLVDSDLDDLNVTAVLKQMESDPELRRTWQRYHIIGAALRHDLAGSVDMTVADRVAARIRGDSVVRPPLNRWRPGGRSLRQGVGLALAASVAAIAILSLQPGDRTDTGGELRLAAEGGTASSGTTRWDRLPPELQSTLNAYLVEHGEFTASHGLNGLTSYARFVSFDDRQ